MDEDNSVWECPRCRCTFAKPKTYEMETPDGVEHIVICPLCTTVFHEVYTWKKGMILEELKEI